MRGIVFRAAVVSVLVSAGAAHAYSTTSPAKETFHASAIAVAVPFQTDTVVLSGVIERGKARRLLIVEALVGSVAPGESGLFRPNVNGVALQPTDDFGNGAGMSVVCPTGQPIGCTGGAHWWLDLDAAEAANPGTIINKPLNVELIGRGGTSPIGIYATLSARLEKKK